MTRKEWVKEFADTNIYKRIKLARFILFVAVSAPEKDFVSKRKIYERCLEEKDVGDGMPYLEILREVVSYDDDRYLDENLHLNDAAIKERGERLGHAVWETLAEDWLGWTGG